MSDGNRIGPLQAVKVLMNVAERLQRFEPYFDHLESSLKMLEELREEYGLGEDGAIINAIKERLSEGFDKALGDLIVLSDSIDDLRASVKGLEEKLNKLERKLDKVIKNGSTSADSGSRKKGRKR